MNKQLIMPLAIVAVVGVIIVMLYFGIEKFMGMFSGIGKGVSSFFGSIGQKAGNLGSAIVKDVQITASDAQSAITKTGSAVVNAATTASSDISHFSSGAATTITNYSKMSAGYLISGAKTVQQDAIGAAQATVYDIGHNPVSGAVQKGVSIAKTDTVNAAKTVAADAHIFGTQTVKQFQNVSAGAQSVAKSVSTGFNKGVQESKIVGSAISTRLQSGISEIKQGAGQGMAVAGNTIQSISHYFPPVSKTVSTGFSNVQKAASTVSNTVSSGAQSVAKFFHL